MEVQINDIRSWNDEKVIKSQDRHLKTFDVSSCVSRVFLSTTGWSVVARLYYCEGMLGKSHGIALEIFTKKWKIWYKKTIKLQMLHLDMIQ